MVKTRRQTRRRSSKPRKNISSRLNSTINKLRREIIQNGVGKKRRRQVDTAKAKKAVAGYKAEYKASGSNDSYHDWVIKKGHAKRNSMCSIM